MNIQILNRWSLAVIFEYNIENNTIALTVKAALAAGTNLSGANLRDANLRDANLSGANLRDANLRDANLRDANLSGANLRDANLRDANLSDANLSGANLSDADLSGANLRDADLSGANLSGADLRDADLSGANLSDVPTIPNIHQEIYAAASKPQALDMGVWHNSCGTAHCRAGWVVTLAGEQGKALEEKTSTASAAMLIYLASDPTLRESGAMPDFYCDNDSALADMKRLAEEEANRPINAE